MTADDELTAARLLRLGGPRPPVPADRTRRVREAVHLDWRRQTRTRAYRRRIGAGTVLLAMAATLFLAFRVSIDRGSNSPSSITQLAVVERAEGLAQRMDGLRAGEWLETGRSGRVALRLPGGTSLRVDVDSRLRLISDTTIELAGGGIYVDTGHGATGLQVQTPFGTAHDIGTQFEVRVTDSLRIRVRSGIVELRRDNDTRAVRAGTELAIRGASVESREVDVFGPDWEWASRVGKPFAIEGRTLTAFLDHLSREQGWILRYQDQRLAREASSVTLHGSVDGLSAGDALAVVLNTTGFTHRLQDGELVIARSAPAR